MLRRRKPQKLHADLRKLAQSRFCQHPLQPCAGLRPAIEIRFDPRPEKICEMWRQREVGYRERPSKEFILPHLRFEIVHHLRQIVRQDMRALLGMPFGAEHTRADYRIVE